LGEKSFYNDYCSEHAIADILGAVKSFTESACNYREDGGSLDRTRMVFAAMLLGFLGITFAQDKYVCNPCQFRIAASVAEKLLLHRVEPDYPKEVKATGVSGQVVVRFVIDKRGNAVGVFAVAEDQQVASTRDPQIIEAATNAVKKWKFKPYLLAGNPVVVETMVTFHFDFADSKK
jgi:TonB family protein